MRVTTSLGARFLYTSPEYVMKRLLAEGAPDIFFLGHVFRDGERGRNHSPEFSMIEWYRKGATLEQLIDETLALIRLFTGPLPIKRYTYHEAFRHFTGEEVKDQDLDLMMATVVEPQFTKEALTVISHFPASQAALAVIEGDVAHRFEIYAGGLELCNGYSELQDPVEQKARLLAENERRLALGKEKLPLDPFFLEALEKGLPACSGVAVGFDRLLMLAMKASHIDEVQLMPWERL